MKIIPAIDNATIIGIYSLAAILDKGNCQRSTLYNPIFNIIPDKSIDLIVTDPPYEIVAGGSGGCFGVEHRDYHHEYKTLAVEEHKREGLKIISNTKKLAQNLNCVCAGFDYKLLDELDRVMKKINIYIWCNKTQVSSLMKHYEDKDCNVDLLVWVKTNPIPTCNNKYLSD